MKNILWILIFSLSLINFSACSKDSDPIISNDIYKANVDWPLDNDEKEVILGDRSFGDMNGLLDEIEKSNLDSIFNNKNEAWFIGHLSVDLRKSQTFILEEALWWNLPRFSYCGPYYEKESIKDSGLDCSPDYLIFGIYLIQYNPYYKINKFYYSYLDSLSSGNWHQLEVDTRIEIN